MSATGARSAGQRAPNLMRAACVAAVIVAAVAVEAAQVPTVAVIASEPAGLGPDVAQIATQRYRAVLNALADANIPVKETSDSVVERAGLPDVPVAIIPCSHGISEEQLRHLRAFLNRPARLIVFYPADPALCAEIGAEVGPALREDAPGQFFAARRTDGSVLAMPDRLVFDARMIRRLTAGPQAEVLAEWYTVSDRRTHHPAVVVSNRGTLVSCAPSAQRRSELTQLLRALIGHHAPDLWTALAPRNPRTIGPVGHYDSLSEFAAALRRSEEAHLAGARADVREAYEQLASVIDALGHGRQDEAIAASRRAIELAHRAWWRSYPSRTPEIRGAWASPTVDGDWDDACRRLAEANFNVCFPYMASGAAAWYPSDVLPRANGSDGDPLAEAIAAAHDHGIEMHPRILGLFTMGASPEEKARLKEQGRIARSPSGADMGWLCPSHEDNRERIVRTALEMLTKYDADGLQFDYLRYAWKDRCVCDGCRRRFEADTGVTVRAWPEDVLGGAHRGAFLQWRRETITSLLRTVRREMKRVRPDATLSAAVFINWEGHRDSFGQDWKRWIDEGLIDFVCPMTYMADMEDFQGWVRKQEAWSGGKVPVAMGIGPFADIDPGLSPQNVLDQVQASRRLGCEGFVIFNYQRALADDYLPKMALGATSTPARIPGEAR